MINYIHMYRGQGGYSLHLSPSKSIGNGDSPVICSCRATLNHFLLKGERASEFHANSKKVPRLVKHLRFSKR